MSGWGALIAGVLGAGASVYGANKAKQSAKSLKNQQQPLVNQQLANMGLLSQYAQGVLPQSSQNLNMVQSYLRNMMSGDRATTLSTLAPEINNLTQQYQGAVQSQRSQLPRGGTSASAAGQLPYQLQGNINNLLFSARPQAAQQLGALGSQQASLGLGALGGAGGLTNNMLNYGLNAQNQMFGQGQAIGQGVGSLISPFLQYMMMNNNLGGSKTGNSPYISSNTNTNTNSNPIMGSSPSQFPQYGGISSYLGGGST